jgi:uncharacterized protein HemY
MAILVLVLAIILMIVGGLVAAPSSRNPFNNRYKRRKEAERNANDGSDN